MQNKKSSKEIRSLRREASLTQKQMAEELGVAQSYISNLETGSLDITLSKFLHFC